MSENLWEIVDIYQRRLKQLRYYIIAFGAINILMLVVFFVLTNTIYNDTVPFYLLLTVPAVFIVSLLILYTTYTERRTKARIRVIIGLNEVLYEWKMQAVEETIANIESIDPVPLEKIESYTHTILNEKLVAEFPSLNLNKLRVVFPDTQQTLQKLLNQQPFLGTYYQVEQQFVKSFEDESKV